MTDRVIRRRAPIIAALAVALTGFVGPADAAPEPHEGAGACAPSAAARTTGRAPDGPAYTRRQLRRVDRELAETLAARQAPTARVGAELRIAVHVHVIRGESHRGPSKQRVRRQLAVLEDAYAGGQSEENTGTPFSFRLASFERVRKARWVHATMGSSADRAMRRKLHRGDATDLNLYLLRPHDPELQGIVLGWSSVPWQAAENVRLDGVSLHQGSLPGGSLGPYDLGDTAVHEVGHWLGLLHTFEGGCSTENDFVEDTPAQGEPSSTCEGVKDTCVLPGDDPVHNFMDYAVDECMDMFTPGQVSRMTDNWLAYRTP